jgi:hypothetical protein
MAAGARLGVCTTHLKAKKDRATETTRTIEVHALLQGYAAFAAALCLPRLLFAGLPVSSSQWSR